MKNTVMMIALLSMTSAVMAASFSETLEPHATKQAALNAQTSVSASAKQDQQLNVPNPVLQARSAH